MISPETDSRIEPSVIVRRYPVGAEIIICGATSLPSLGTRRKRVEVGILPPTEAQTGLTEMHVRTRVRFV